MIRSLVLLLALTAVAAPAANAPSTEYVQAVEFPYYLYPRPLWERELAWLKNIGIRTVAFSIPRNWHQLENGEFDFSGRTAPRRDLQGLVKLLRRLGLHAWIRPSADPRPPAQWTRALEEALASQTVSHSGPIACVEGRVPSLGVPPPPSPVHVLAATDPAAFLRSREIIASGQGSLLWTDVEDSLYPAGWEPARGVVLKPGAVGLSGDERPATAGLRREAALLRNWAKILPSLHPVAMPKPAAGKLPEGVTAVELTSPAISAVIVTNSSKLPFRDDLRVFEPVSRRTLVMPAVSVLPGESLWLPLSVSMGQNGLCRECSIFSNAEQIVYATAELLSIEFENGILAMEFAAPQPGEVILQLERQPVGPFLAGGKPSKFDWDDKALRTRLTIPAGTGVDHRVRIGIGMEEPETSAFFNEARRLIIGRKNPIDTTYSSAEVAARSRLRLPDGYTATSHSKSPNEIDYEVVVPPEAVHGDFANLAIEADGVLLGRARLQLFRPLSLRILEAIQMHIGRHAELTPDPPIVVVEPKAGTNLEVSLRNNWPAIQTFRVDASGDGLDFFPPKNEIIIGPMDERRYSLRVFAAEPISGLRDFHLKVSGGATMDLPMRVLLLPRGRTVVWSADLDGDGSVEWVLESHRARAIFSSQDGGRWMEFNWKEANANFLPESGAFRGQGPVELRSSGDGIEIAGKGWKRTVRLSDSTLTVDQPSSMPSDGPPPLTQGNVRLTVQANGPSQTIYKLQ